MATKNTNNPDGFEKYVVASWEKSVMVNGRELLTLAERMQFAQHPDLVVFYQLLDNSSAKTQDAAWNLADTLYTDGLEDSKLEINIYRREDFYMLRKERMDAVLNFIES